MKIYFYKKKNSSTSHGVIFCFVYNKFAKLKENQWIQQQQKRTAHKFNIPQNVLHKNVKKITDTILFNYGQNI